MRDPRYRFQSPLVKAFRWLRYRPYYALLGVLAVASWAARGCKPDSTIWEGRVVDLGRLSAVKLIWACYRGQADYAMGHWYTLEEVFGE